MNKSTNTTKNILTVLIVIATFVLSNYLGLIGLLIGLVILGIIGFITNKKSTVKSSIIRVIVGVLLAIAILFISIVLFSWIIDYFAFVA